MTRPITIAALGSSFAAGPGIEPVVDDAAMRSGRNYAHLLADRLDAHLVDLTVSGATTANVVDTTQVIDGDASFEPQIDGLPEGADLVTITAGGNDLRFLSTLLSVAWLRVDPSSPVVATLGGSSLLSIPVPTAEAVESATVGLEVVVRRAGEKAPGCHVIPVDYLTVLDEHSVLATPFSADELEQLILIQTAVGVVFQEAARRTGIELVSASLLSQDHALGSNDPWVQPFQAEVPQTFGSFHPNHAGMSAIADAIERTLRP